MSRFLCETWGFCFKNLIGEFDWISLSRPEMEVVPNGFGKGTTSVVPPTVSLSRWASAPEVDDLSLSNC